jgi:ferredoxin
MPIIEAETATGVQVFDGESGRKLVLAIEDAGIDILHRCGGNAKCTTCRVEILAGDPEKSVTANVTVSRSKPDSRKTCGSRVRCASLTI